MSVACYLPVVLCSLSSLCVVVVCGLLWFVVCCALLFVVVCVLLFVCGAGVVCCLLVVCFLVGSCVGS